MRAGNRISKRHDQEGGEELRALLRLGTMDLNRAPERFKRKPYFQETGNWKPPGNCHRVWSHCKEWEGNIEYGFKGQFNTQSPLRTQVGTNFFHTQMRSLLQCLVRKSLTPIASIWLWRVGKLLWDFVFIPTLFQKQYKVSYKNKIETL